MPPEQARKEAKDPPADLFVSLAPSASSEPSSDPAEMENVGDEIASVNLFV
jgi:hypothetical protein